MKVIEIGEYGSPDVLRLSERADPEPVRGEVVVRIAYSGVNRADLLQRRGQYPAPKGFPQDVPGLEYAGTVEALGEGCELRSIGDPVMGVVGGGSYADRIVVPERETIAVPDGMSLDQAAGVPEAFMTAWDALFKQADLKSGEVVLIHAVGSGVGTAGLQLALSVGAHTVGTSRTAEKLKRTEAMGLNEAVQAGLDGQWAEEVAERLQGEGVDVVLDLVGSAYLEGNLQVLGTGCRWMMVGVSSGSTGTIDLRRLMGKRASLTGTVLRARPAEEKALLAREFERTVVPLFETSRLRPVLDRVFPASEAPAAHRYLEENRSFGTITLGWEADSSE